MRDRWAGDLGMSATTRQPSTVESEAARVVYVISRVIEFVGLGGSGSLTHRRQQLGDLIQPGKRHKCAEHVQESWGPPRAAGTA